MRHGATLTLPVSAESSDVFVKRLACLFGEPTTRVYIDTSFLMWMTRIGSPARRELAQWLTDLCGMRLRVPVWAAHEYYRHHSEGTLLKDLREQLEALENAVSSTYAQVWPLLDEPLGGAASAQAQQTEVRDILRAVPGVAELARRWSSEYDRHAREVIDFINKNALADSRVPAYFETLEATANARFAGRVPPGFKDRWKKERKGFEEDGTEAHVGSNRWGDLVFWREILDNARWCRARQVILLTRDAKNDWRTAGTLPVEPPGDGSSVPPAHPFLSFEAALEAGVGEVLLVDPNRLASLAKLTVESQTKAFVFVAHAPSLPPPKSLEERREEDRRREMAARNSVRNAMAAANGLRYMDPDGFRAPASVLIKALLESREDRPPSEKVLEFERDLKNGEGNAAEMLTEERVLALGGAGLVHLARRLSRRAGVSGAESATVSDLTQSLRHFPTKVAGALYFGLLTDAYLEPAGNNPWSAPRSAALQTLFGYQTEPWALTPIRVLLDRLNKAERVPLYLPNPTAPLLKISCHAYGDQEPPTRLRAIRVKGLDLITSAQGNPALQLAARLGAESATPQVLLRHAVELYGLPIAQLELETDVEAAYDFEPTTGFKPPHDVWLDPLELRS